MPWACQMLKKVARIMVTGLKAVMLEYETIYLDDTLYTNYVDVEDRLCC